MKLFSPHFYSLPALHPLRGAGGENGSIGRKSRLRVN